MQVERLASVFQHWVQTSLWQIISVNGLLNHYAVDTVRKVWTVLISCQWASGCSLRAKFMNKNIKYISKDYDNSVSPSRVLRARWNPLIFAFFERWLPITLLFYTWKFFIINILITSDSAFFHHRTAMSFVRFRQ